MNVLIIGGTRFIGPYVVRRLVAGGHTVTVFHRGETETDLPEEVAHLHGNRENIEKYIDQLRDLGPDVVLDMAPRNERHATTLIRALEAVTQRFVVISSQDVYRAFGLVLGVEAGDLEPLPLTEESALRSIHFPYRNKEKPGDPMYNYEKILVENAYLEHCRAPSTVLRLPMVYGPGDNQHRLYSHVKRMDDGRAAILMAEDVAGWKWTRAYVEDVALAIELAITHERAVNQVFNVGQPDTLSERAWVERIGRIAGWNGEVVTVPRDELPEHLVLKINSTQELVTDSSKIRRDLGFEETVSFEDGLQRTIDWERENPPASGRPTDEQYRQESDILKKLGYSTGQS